MNPPIQSTRATSYQQSATPMYPLKPHQVPVMPDGYGSSAGYPPAAGYPPPMPANDPGACIAAGNEVMFLGEISVLHTCGLLSSIIIVLLIGLS